VALVVQVETEATRVTELLAMAALVAPVASAALVLLAFFQAKMAPREVTEVRAALAA
jgi:hypothetical protein